MAEAEARWKEALGIGIRPDYVQRVWADALIDAGDELLSQDADQAEAADDDFQKARDHLAIARNLNVDDPEIPLHLARVCLRQARAADQDTRGAMWEQVDSWFETARQLNPGSVVILAEHARALAEYSRIAPNDQYRAVEAGAQARWNLALRSNPRIPSLYTQWAWSLWEGGNTTAALERYRQAISLNPMDSSSWYSLAVLQLREHDKAAAESAFGQALLLGADYERLLPDWNYQLTLSGYDSAARWDEVLRVRSAEETYIKRGDAFFDAGNYSAAERWYSTAVAAAPTSQRAGKRLAAAQERLRPAKNNPTTTKAARLRTLLCD